MRQSKYHRGCDCTHDGAPGHGSGDWTEGDDPVEIEYDFACVLCGRVVPTCEGGGVWDDAVASMHNEESHLGVCVECSTRLTAYHGDVRQDRAVNILYPGQRRRPRLKAKRLGNMTLRYR